MNENRALYINDDGEFGYICEIWDYKSSDDNTLNKFSQIQEQMSEKLRIKRKHSIFIHLVKDFIMQHFVTITWPIPLS